MKRTHQLPRTEFWFDGWRRPVAIAVLGLMAMRAAVAGAGRGGAVTSPVAGPLQLELALPAGRLGFAEPLVATGVAGRGDTVFVFYAAPGTIRLGWDSTVDGAFFSPPVPVRGRGPHRLLVAMGALLPPVPSGTEDDDLGRKALDRLLVLQFDGRTVMLERGTFQPASTPPAVSLGSNRVGAAIVHPYFTGKIVSAVPIAPTRALAEAMQVGRWTPGFSGAAAKFPGAVRLRLRLPETRLAAADPLIVTGRYTKGDFINVEILDAHHVRFGFDHWAVGGLESPPIAVDLGAVHELVLTMGALYPPGAAESVGPWRHQVAVWLDGRRVLFGKSECHPTTPEEIILGYNLIGGSTTGPLFRGTILGVEPVTSTELGRLDP